MATLGFFTFGGSQWNAFEQLPQLVPNARFFETSNSESAACRECIAVEARCAAVREPWKHSCERLIEGTTVAQTSTCHVRSHIGSRLAAQGTPLLPVFAACRSLCSRPDSESPHAAGYARPFRL
jgi:hypothetical protein